eukprot:jgi/Botrbrau1/9454/Bobra.0252s0075.1
MSVSVAEKLHIIPISPPQLHQLNDQCSSPTSRPQLRHLDDQCRQFHVPPAAVFERPVQRAPILPPAAYERPVHQFHIPPGAASLERPVQQFHVPPAAVFERPVQRAPILPPAAYERPVHQFHIPPGAASLERPVRKPHIPPAAAFERPVQEPQTVQPDSFADVVRAVHLLGSDLVQHADKDRLHVRFRRAQHSFQTLSRLGWPEACGDLLLTFHVLPAPTMDIPEAPVPHGVIVLAEPTCGCHVCHLKCRLQKNWVHNLTPVLTQVRRIVNEHVSELVKSTNSKPQRQRSKKKSAPQHLFAYLPVLVKHVRDRMESLDVHCVACDRKLFAIENACAPTCMVASCNGDCVRPRFQPALCESLGCKKAVQLQLPLYLHPASLDLLITLFGAALWAKASRRKLIFGDSVELDDGYWLEGMLVGQAPQWERMKVKLNNFPRLKQQGPATKKVHLQDPHPLRLMNWVVLTFDGVLLPLSTEAVPCLPEGWDPFLVQAGNMERANAFRHRKRSADGKSLFAYHGSPLWNWHSIVRQDIKNASGTPLQAHRSDYGPGIYLSPDPQVVVSYCGGPSQGLVIKLSGFPSHMHRPL